MKVKASGEPAEAPPTSPGEALRAEGLSTGGPGGLILGTPQSGAEALGPTVKTSVSSHPLPATTLNPESWSRSSAGVLGSPQAVRATVGVEGAGSVTCWAYVHSVPRELSAETNSVQ